MTADLRTPTGTPASRFAFGTMQFGGKADEAAARAMFDACRAAGITHFDTAYTYTDGESERMLGRFAAAERDELFIATKANFGAPATRATIMESFEESRSRLGMDTIDLFYMHRWDGETPLEETFEALAELKQAGRIGHIGVSNYAAWQVMKAQCVAASFGVRIDVIQPMYNLAKRQAEVEILPMCASEGIRAVPYSPLGGGLLTGKYAGGGSGRLTEDERYSARYGVDAAHETAGKLVALAGEMGLHPATLAAAWVARHPAAPVPILSARSAEQLAPSLAAVDFEMDDATYAALCALSVTPPPATDRLEEV
ncbi:aldo/keto reductase [Salipiger mucosus]|uniref:Oxidoreductase, aldo/keto reductase family n=1 Tax=Salipiger mucosus DSM 16094 TaxID=1123237 RepID=S9SKD4_9RHOB|nr:aldo/keto reductase [Salipiger mucosus]EPX86844.1 Oxidoreductase, aldo/keto reductase family [Salipiger mucosus DSM 16094]